MIYEQQASRCSCKSCYFYERHPSDTFHVKISFHVLRARRSFVGLSMDTFP